MRARLLLVILLTALIARMGLLLMYSGTGVAEQMDAKDYAAIATNLLQGNGFLNYAGEFTSNRPPAYPLFLAAIYAVSGNSDFWVKIFQCLLDTASVGLIFLIARKTFGAPAGLLAAAIAALYPPQILYSNLRLSETLFTFLVVSEVYLWIRTMENGSVKYGALAGVAHGLATLCRSAVMFFPVFLLPVILVMMKGRRKLPLCFAAYFLVSSCLISMWTVRNYRAFGVIIPVTTGSGHLMWFAMQKDAWEGDKLIELSPEREYPELADVPRYKWDGFLTPKIVKYAAANPLEYSKVLFRNELRFWAQPVGKVMLAARSSLLAGLYQTAHYFLLAGALAGLLLLNRKTLLAAAPMFTLLVYVAVMHSVVLAIPRYRLPFDFILIILFAAGIAELNRKRFQGAGL